MTGRKKYFLNSQVPYVVIENLEYLTVKNVLEKVYSDPNVRVYLPDYDENPERHISRDFLFAIVNKLDPTFFKRAAADIASRRKLKPLDDKITSLPVKPELLKILQEAK